MPGSVLARLRVLAADVDDTITTSGKLPARTLDLFEELAAAGLAVVLVTGRSAGWAQALAGYLSGVRLVVGENGLVCFDGDGRRRDLGPPRDEAFGRVLLENAERVARAFQLTRTDDDDFRLFERTFVRPVLFDADALRACGQLVDPGFEVIASSIHIHVRPSGWDKADGLLAALAPVLRLWSLTPTPAFCSWVTAATIGRSLRVFPAPAWACATSCAFSPSWARIVRPTSPKAKRPRVSPRWPSACWPRNIARRRPASLVAHLHLQCGPYLHTIRRRIGPQSPKAGVLQWRNCPERPWSPREVVPPPSSTKVSWVWFSRRASSPRSPRSTALATACAAS